MKSAFSKNPILIIDRDGLIGEPLSLKLSKEFLVVFASRKKLELGTENQNIIHVSFSKKFPVIPDNKYSHIIFVDEEKKDLELLPSIINKIKDVNADFIAVQGISSAEEHASGKAMRTYPNAKEVLIGDIFDSELILRKKNFKSVINKFIYQAQKFGKIQVLGDGLREAYPVFLGDVVNGLIDLVFGMHKSNSLFYIFPKHPPSELSLAHMIQKINPEITVDFIRHDPRLKFPPYPPNGVNLLGDKYPLARKIRNVDIKKKVKIRDEGFDREIKKRNYFSSFLVWILIFLLLSPLVFTSALSFMGESTLGYARKEMGKGNIANVKSSLRLSQALFYVGKQTSSILSFQARITGQESRFKKLLGDVSFGYEISEAVSQMFASENYFSKILRGKSENPINDFAMGEKYLKSSVFLLDKIKAEEKISAQILQNLEKISPLIKLLSATSDILPNVLGMEGERNYLILFQDDMELRPNGGIIDSYGVLRFNMGKIEEFMIHDVADADKKLMGHIEPPFAIRRHLPEKHWYMKDSGFEIDFVKSALSSLNFLFVETGRKADGVIAVDLSFVKNILHAVGPVYVKEYGQTVHEDNLYMLMQSHADKNFSISLNKAMFAKVTEERVSYLLVAQAISDSLAQKHLLLAFKDEQNIFTANGWSSSLWDERKSGENLVNDFMGINEANLGINKANYFIKRQVSQKVIIGNNGNISEELMINFKNESATLSGVDYKNYLRIILPKNTKLSEVLIGDKPQDVISAITDPLIYEAKNFKAFQGLEVEEIQGNNNAIFGFVINVPAGEIVKVRLRYEISGSVLGLNAFSYNLKLFKQPGVDNIPYSLSLTYPDSLGVVESSGNLIMGEGKVSYSEKIVGDKTLIVDFAKK